MKKIFRHTFIATCAILAGATAACSDDTPAQQDKGATPVVKYARPTSIELSDSLLTQAPLGDKIVFVGENLGDVSEIWFNDQKASLMPTMVTSHTIIVTVPNNIPGEVTDNVRFITSTGIEISFPFHVTVPAPRVSSMDCEYAPAGSTVLIKGAYFADDPNVPLSVTIGGQPAQIRSITQTELEVTVPEGAGEEPVVVTTIYGRGVSSFRYRDTRGMLFDFEPDGITGLGMASQCWHARPTRSDETSISGDYMIIGDGETVMKAAGDYDDSHFSFEYWPGSWNTPIDYPARVGERLFDVADFTGYADKSVKFELYIPAANAWQAGAMQIIFAPTSMVALGNGGLDVFGDIVPKANNEYIQEGGLARYLWRPWTAAEAYHTGGKWVTVTCPIKDFVYDHDGAGATRMLTSVTDFASLRIFVWDGGMTGVDCTPMFYIDNIRVVPN